ncbi:Protein of unknown function [Pyronema omphalodes CBS 100304]|uniref:Uncharacterized protein n=1 Tax=Pyronema omphalodes (strain CBS 100304) TaxID=1076935 RepID=U4LEA0_PYROM|nr:Protein of unknown function [Pyronema omphalodes CBS 100304]
MGSLRIRRMGDATTDDRCDAAEAHMATSYSPKKHTIPGQQHSRNWNCVHNFIHLMKENYFEGVARRSQLNPDDVK